MRDALRQFLTLRLIGVFFMISALLLTPGCASMMRVIGPKTNVAEFMVEDTPTNRIMVASSIQSVAERFGFEVDHGEDWVNPLFAYSYSESRSAPPYLILGYVNTYKMGIKVTNSQWKIVVGLSHANITGKKTAKFIEVRDAVMQTLTNSFGSNVNSTNYLVHQM